MVKLVDKQNIFNSGILSSKLYSRDDLKQYNNGLADAVNFICSRYGPVEKRVGTKFILDLNNPDEDVFFLPFVFSIKQSFLLEFLENKIRFYTFAGTQFGAVPDPINPSVQYEIETPFTKEQLTQISYVQSLDVIYLAFADRKTKPYTLSRYGDQDWRLEEFQSEDGPYLDQNFDTGKKVRITDINQVSSTVALIGFSLGEVDGPTAPGNHDGRWIRINTPRYNENTYSFEDKWSYGRISGVGQAVWSADQSLVYTAKDTPAVGEAVYKNIDKSTKLGTIQAIESQGETLVIKVLGKRYLYNRAVTSGAFAWTNQSSVCYINAQESARRTVYTSSATPAKGAKIYSDSALTSEYSTLAAGYGTEVDIKYFSDVKGDKYYYSDTVKVGSATRYVWKQASYIYADAQYQNRIGSIKKKVSAGEVQVQLDSADPSTASLNNLDVYKKLGTSIIVDWTYRNYIDEDDKAWMTTETSEWRLGVWHRDTGNADYPVTYPTKVTIHQQRLVWAGMTNKPWVWTSNSFAYRNYAPSDFEGVIADTNSIYYDISTDKVSDIFWLKSVKYLLIGTELGEIRMYSSGTALSPSDVVSNRESSYGAHNSEPIVNDDNIVFIQRLQRTIRSLMYDDNRDSFVGPELTVLAENLTVGGIKKIVFQKEPNNTYWCLKEDGTLLTLTYDSAQDVIGWSKSTIAGQDAKVIDLTVLPSNVYQQDMVLFAIERTIGGVKKRYLELLSKNFTHDVKQNEACFLDSAIRLKEDEIEAVAEEDEFWKEYVGLDNDNYYIGEINHLIGETVRVTDEGALMGDYEVKPYIVNVRRISDDEIVYTYTAGLIEVEYPVMDAWVGLPYNAEFETLERDFQDKQISTKMSKLRVYNFKMYLERTLGVTLKRLDRGSFATLVTFDPSQKTDEAPELLTGKFNIEVPSAWDCDYRLKIVSEPGLPCTVAGLIIGVEINEL